MNVRKSAWSVLGLSIAMVGIIAAAALAQEGKPKKMEGAKIGEPAPAWTLMDANGKEFSLKQFAGKNVVMEWINPDCPYVVGCYNHEVVASTVKALKEIDSEIVYLTINSTANKPEADVKESTVAFLKEHDVDVPSLFDYDGKVGMTFGARTTPHVFVIDGEGVLRYHGAYTDDPSSKREEKTNYVLNAVKQLTSGETVSPDHVKSWGCSVKYARNKSKGEGESGNRPY